MMRTALALTTVGTPTHQPPSSPVSTLLSLVLRAVRKLHLEAEHRRGLIVRVPTDRNALVGGSGPHHVPAHDALLRPARSSLAEPGPWCLTRWLVVVVTLPCLRLFPVAPPQFPFHSARKGTDGVKSELKRIGEACIVLDPGVCVAFQASAGGVPDLEITKTALAAMGKRALSR